MAENNSGPTLHYDSSMSENDMLIQAAVQYYTMGDFLNAEKTFLQALSINPQRPDVLVSISKLYYEWKRFPEALNYIMSAVRIAPSNIEAWHGLAQIAKISNNQRVYDTAMQQISLLENRRKGQEELQNVQDRFIVFVTDRPGARDAKLAWGLKQNGWNVILLHKEKPIYNPQQYYSDTIQYHNSDEALSIARNFQPAIFHLFSTWIHNTAATFIKNKPGKVVFDDYDVMAGMVKKDFLDKNYPGQLEMERLCMENADGLCCRSPQTQYAKQNLGYRFGGDRLLMVDCCWGNSLYPLSKPEIRQDFHIAYCGNMYLCDDPSDAEKCELLEMATNLAEHHIHFHIYPAFRTTRNLEFDQAFAGYLELQQKTDYFHLHETVDSDKLVKELSQYDAGWFDYSPYSNGYINVYQEWMYTYYAATNKIFDYIDAGLPVIINSSWFVEKTLGKTNILVKITPEFKQNPASFLKRFDWEKLKNNARAAKEYYDVRKQAKRLIKFYQCL